MRIVRYFAVGAVGAVVDFSLFFVLALMLSVHYLIAGAAGFVLAVLVNYVLSIRFVFQSGVRFSRRGELIAVFIISAIGLSVHQVGLYVAVETFGIHLMLAKVIATGLVFVWNYGCRSRFVFAPSKSKLAESLHRREH